MFVRLFTALIIVAFGAFFFIACAPDLKPPKKFVSPLGLKKVALIPVVQTQTYATPLAATSVTKALEKLHTWLQEVSYTKAGIDLNSVQVFEPISISFESDVCNAKVSDEARLKFLSANKDALKPYELRIWLLPSAIQCRDQQGFDPIDGSPELWVNELTLPTLAHEVGHAFGLAHSGLWDCGAKTLGSEQECEFKEYGDPADIMGFFPQGSGGVPHYNALQKQRLGWLKNAVHVTKSGEYTLAALTTLADLAKNQNLPQALNVGPYTVELRALDGFDKVLSYDQNGAPTGNMTKGVLIHQEVPLADKHSEIVDELENSTVLLRLHPEKNMGSANIDQALEPSEVFQDCEEKIKITTLWVGAVDGIAQAQVRIELKNQVGCN